MTHREGDAYVRRRGGSKHLEGLKKEVQSKHLFLVITIDDS